MPQPEPAVPVRHGKPLAREAERLSEHVAGCEKCSALLSDGWREDTRLMAELLTPGTALLAEREYVLARRALLEDPEPVSPRQLELVETSLGRGGQPQQVEVPAQVGPYRVRYELGRGAMGVVYRAEHVNLKRDAALKILHPHLMADRDIVQRFYGEMAAFGRLRDPHIVQAYDAGQANGVHFLATEYIDGTDAAKLCARVGPLPVAAACEIVRQAALGLETARQHNMVHRDIKPSNLMVGRDEQVKILDFGLASFRQDGSDFHLEHDPVGTLDYMAPEQWNGSPQIDYRADIYSLGCALFKLLIGHPPFAAAPHDGLSKMQAHLLQPPPAARKVRPGIPRDVDALVARMLAKRPGDRLADLREIVESLTPFCQHSRLAALVADCVPSQPPGTRRADSTPVARTRAIWASAGWARPVRWAVAAVAAVALLGAVLIQVNRDGTVSIRVDRPEVTIQVGDAVQSTGESGQSVTVRVPPGQQRIRVSKEGFQPEEVVVHVRRGNNPSIDVSLSPAQSPPLAKTPVEAQLVLVGHEGSVSAVDISGDGRWILTGGDDKSMRLWNAATGKQQRCLVGHDGALTAVAFTADGKQAVSASSDGTARLWNLETGEEIRRFSGHTDQVMGLSLSRDGSRLLTSSMDRTVRLWDVQTGEGLAILIGHRSWVRGVAFLPNQQQAISCGNDAVAIVWDLATGRMQTVLQGHTHVLSRADISADGRYAVTGSWDNTVRLWDLRGERQLNVLQRHRAPVRRVSLRGRQQPRPFSERRSRRASVEPIPR